MLSLIPMVAMVPTMVGVLRGGWSSRTGRAWSRTRSSKGSRTGKRLLTTLWSEADCQILSALASSFLGSLMSSLIRWVQMSRGKLERKKPLNMKHSVLWIL